MSEFPSVYQSVHLSGFLNHRWITAEWLACSKSCGGGISTRNVYCVQVMGDGSFKPSDQDCLDEKPASKKPCNQFPCPIWKAGDWAPVSVTVCLFVCS